MVKILIETAFEQKIVQIPKGGAVKGCQVLWDERVDGEFPSNMLASVGGLDRVGNALVVNAGKLATYQAAQTALQQSEAQKQMRIQQAKQLLGNLPAGTFTAAEATQAIRAIVVILKDLSQQV